jgi:hypothetical protein
MTGAYNERSPPVLWGSVLSGLQNTNANRVAKIEGCSGYEPEDTLFDVVILAKVRFC